MAVEVQIKKKLGDFELNIEMKSDSRRIGILGASGCGKSMTLKSIAGIETPDFGKISIDGRKVFCADEKLNLKPQKRNIGYLFQNYALFPTMTVRANIVAGLKGTREENAKRVQEMLTKFQLNGLEDRLPGELSGGQQQRTALARIMAYEPDAILLDEPYSALDGFLKDRLQQEMQEMLADYEGTVILVSHSRDEIYRFSEELFIMDEGRMICGGRTKELFENPGWKEAARLTGCKNIAAAERTEKHTILVSEWGIELQLSRGITEEMQYIGMRAHDFIPVWGNRRKNCVPVKVRSTAELPFERKYFLDVNGNSGEEICWFVQREMLDEIDKKGLPDYLEMPEEKILILK